MSQNPNLTEVNVKLRLNLRKIEVRPKNRALLMELRAKFDELMDRTIKALLKSIPQDSELHVGPLQIEVTPRDEMFGAKTYFRSVTDKPKGFRSIIQRLALTEERKLRRRYHPSVRLEVAEVWDRPDGEPSG